MLRSIGEVSDEFFARAVAATKAAPRIGAHGPPLWQVVDRAINAAIDAYQNDQLAIVRRRRALAVAEDLDTPAVAPRDDDANERADDELYAIRGY